MTSIALIVLDTVRKDYFDKYFNWLDGLRFEEAHATANWTGPVHASLFTGNYGSAVNVSSKSRSLDCNQEVLAEELQQAGYTTRAWSANPNVSETVNFDRGFNKFVGPHSIENPDKDILNIEKEASKYNHLPRYKRYPRIAYNAIMSDCDTIATLEYGLRKVIDAETSSFPDDGASIIRDSIKNTDFKGKEFLFVNLMEAHTPYFPPESYRDFDTPVQMPFGEAYLGVEDPELVRRGYDSSVHYLGEIYKEIFELIYNDFDYVITLSDHGELLGEHHGMWNHVTGIYPELTHVPLVISGDGLNGQYDMPVSLLDVYSTILTLAGINSDKGQGQPLLPLPTEQRPYLAEYRGPFDKSLQRAKSEGIDLDRFDRDLFALIESNYYGYEDYDGWHEIGETERLHPQTDLHELIRKYDMIDIDHKESRINSDVEDQLERLGYM